MSSSDNSPDFVDEKRAAVRPRSMSRRSLLTKSAKAMPIVLTLHSGAALARSSNLISATTTPEIDDLGRTMCLDETSVDPVGKSGKYDLGEPPYAKVHAIWDRDYYVLPDDRADSVTIAQMCENGGTFYYKDDGLSLKSRGWNELTLPKGMLVSGTALTSFTGAIDYVDI